MYKALYRKWRPKTFDDVISQSHVTNTLKNQLVNDKTAHAYLFTGSRGTGKTTCARIFAKALCCLNNTNGNPCLQCEICHDAEDSRISDIIEIDAASNNSVEDIRDLREGAIYLPERCKYKIYIIDEVHMLSTSAFNALLKIMEEPPQYVKFILATTEVHKVPTTILSRCQRFDFKRILPEDISARLLHIAKNEGFTLSNEASFLIAKLSDGGMRDAISLLDQASAFSNDITEDVISSAVGIAGREYLFNALDYIKNKEVSKLFELLDTIYMQSKNLSVFCSDLIAQMRNVMVLKVAPSQSNTLVCMPDELEHLTELSKSLDLDTILYYMNSLEGCYNRLSKSVDKRVELEVSLADICNHDFNTSNTGIQTDRHFNDIISNLVERLNSLEKRLSNYSTGQYNSMYSEPIKNTIKSSNTLSAEFKKLNPKDFKPLPQWQNILNELKSVSPGICGSLNGSNAFIYNEYILIVAKTEMFVSLFKQQYNANILNSVVSQVLGGHYKIMAKYDKNSANISNSTQNIGLNSSFSNLIDRAKNNNIPTIQID